MAMTKFAIGLGVVLLLALLVGCADASTPSPAPPEPGTNSQVNPANPPIAKLKTAVPAKPVPSSSTGPRLATDIEAIDYGDVPFNTIVAVSLNLKNVGSTPLALEPPFIRVREGC